ncbi:MAPEG-domain-containing protein [Tilletiaria anomala UBC 951]|uniref:Glutathione S-transferase 3, mitochondrial n=1 Tax=Tilletiaria anomala (strain ATCC 24038 / CBS 436.72 / UBC 951) TaxID=1037660 RepID=A0A066WR44_TILAU|nr:MAPEG-domain-containing protein [Tilletiaria anomala UBC 951]KDN53469.1 MAPEG-domain-containing protein [Tilletiaria anomala UBC 951]
MGTCDGLTRTLVIAGVSLQLGPSALARCPRHLPKLDEPHILGDNSHNNLLLARSQVCLLARLSKTSCPDLHQDFDAPIRDLDFDNLTLSPPATKMSALVTLGLPSGYPFVLLATTSSAVLTLWQGILVSQARKAAGVPYPLAYADKAEAQANPKANVFNCTQRAHLNTLENLPQFILTSLIAGLKFPRAAAILSGAWIVSRVLYTLGYVSGEPKKRVHGALPGYVASIGLTLLSITTAVQLAQQTNWAF